LIEIPTLDVVTQARRPEEVEPMARDAVALLLEVPEDSFDLDIRYT
jgi:hypothetical protein